MMLFNLPFEGPFKEENGHKFWKPEEYRGYLIQPYESPIGRRLFLVGDPKTHQWLYNGPRVEDCACFIDMLSVKAGFNQPRSKKCKKGNSKSGPRCRGAAKKPRQEN